MGFKTKKIYGNYKKSPCPFCHRLATQKNEQGIEVCRLHTKNNLQDIKCTCGSWLEPRAGKFGTYYNCLNCGNISLNKAKEIQSLTTQANSQKSLEPTSIKNPSFQKTTFSQSHSPQKTPHSQNTPHPQNTLPPQNTSPSTSSPPQPKPPITKQKKETIITFNDVEYFD